MEPGPLLRPVGPLPTGVYWRRRVVLLALGLLVVYLLANACGGGGTATLGTTPSPSASPRATTSPKPTTAAVARCARGALTVTVDTDAEVYPAGAQPKFTSTVRNVGGVACRAEVSAGTRGLTVMSGNDTVWTTTHCPRTNESVQTVIKPGVALAYATTWSRRRSVQGCATPGPAALPGTYRVTATVAGVTSHEAVFHLTS